MTETEARRLSRRVRFCTVFLVLTGASAVVVGFHDLLTSSQLTFRFVAVGLFVLGVALLAGAYGFVRRRPWCYAVTFAAGLAGFAFGVMFLVTQWVNEIHDLRLVVWAAIAVGFVFVATFAAHEGRLSVEHLARRRVRILSSILSVGALLSVANFWNTAVRVPPTAAPSVTVTTSLKALRPHDGLVPLEGAIGVRNSGGSTVRVLGSVYTLWGGDAAESKGKEATSDAALRSKFVSAIRQKFYSTETPLRGVRKEYDQLAGAGQWVEERSYFVPDDEYKLHPVFYVPVRRYAWVRLEAIVVIAKDTIPLDDYSDNAVKRSGNRMTLVVPLNDRSWLSQLFRGRRVLHSDVVITTPETSQSLEPQLDVRVERRDHPIAGDSAFANRMTRIYNIAQADSAYEIALAQ
jgi:hypothetical protein